MSRRNKGGLAVAGLVFAFVVVLGAGAGSAVRDRAARESRLTAQVEQILDDADRLEQEQKWPEALAAVGRAGSDGRAMVQHRDPAAKYRAPAAESPRRPPSFFPNFHANMNLFAGDNSDYAAQDRHADLRTRRHASMATAGYSISRRPRYNQERRWPMDPHALLADIHALEEEILAFERKYGIRSETFYAAYVSGEEPEDDRWVLDFGEWASVYRTWLARQADYRNEMQRRQPNAPSLAGLIQVAS